MDTRLLIKKAWIYTQNRKRLVNTYGILPALISTIATISIVGYQLFSLRQALYDPQNPAYKYFYSFVSNLFENHPELTWPLIISVALFVCLCHFNSSISKVFLESLVDKIKFRGTIAVDVAL